MDLMKYIFKIYIWRKNTSSIKEYLTKKIRHVNRVVLLAILLADNYDVMTRVRDEGWLSYKINTVAEVRGSQSDEERRRRSDHVWERYIDFLQNVR